MKSWQHYLPVWLLLLSLLFAHWLPAAQIAANPRNYAGLINSLNPGDTLRLAPGQYRGGLRIHRLHGEPRRPIVIEGPAEGEPAVFLGRPGRNSVSILDSAHVVIRNLEIDGQGAFVDAVKAEGHARYAHHITLENLLIHGFDANQQSVGISTKCPAWDWVVRGNRIRNVGTGMYFGNSDGSAPFVGGLIEHNEVTGTIGYNLQVKHQKLRPLLAGLPLRPRVTTIRHNLFSKGENSSTAEWARPNVLLGHFPPTGPGSQDSYLVYANLFLQNPNEALFQGEGNIALYNNLFFTSHRNDFPAIAIQPHNDIPRDIVVLHNTVVNPGRGIRVLRKEEDWVDAQEVIGNAVFASWPLSGGRQSQNFVAVFSAADGFLKSPSDDPAGLDLAPLDDRLGGAEVELARFTQLPQVERDFSGLARSGGWHGACLPGPDDLCGAKSVGPGNQRTARR